MTIRSIAIPLHIDNVDTDQIIPARFLKKTDKIGFGEHLFANWRYTEEGQPRPDFVLNTPAYSSASILIAGANFGCGSSREHAAWAIADFGIQAIISTQFADIFKGNALNNGIVPIELSPEIVDWIKTRITADSSLELEVDLASQVVMLDGRSMDFDMDPFKKECIMQGIDETGYLLNMTQEIEEYEQRRAS